MTMIALLPEVAAFLASFQPLRIGSDGVAGNESLVVTNPSTGAPLATVARASPREIDFAVGAASAAFHGGPWTRMSAAVDWTRDE